MLSNKSFLWPLVCKSQLNWFTDSLTACRSRVEICSILLYCSVLLACILQVVLQKIRKWSSVYSVKIVSVSLLWQILFCCLQINFTTAFLKINFCHKNFLDFLYCYTVLIFKDWILKKNLIVKWVVLEPIISHNKKIILHYGCEQLYFEISMCSISNI